MPTLPKVDGGIIGSSDTWGTRFPEDYPDIELEVVDEVPECDTPFGRSAPFKLLRYKNHRILYIGMHGCFPNDTEVIHPYLASKQVAWVFKKAQVPWVITGGSVGGIQSSQGNDLPPWSVLVPNDFVMWPNVVIVPQERVPRPPRSVFYRLTHPFCPILSAMLVEESRKEEQFLAIESHGVYVCTPWGRFESASEIRAMRDLGWNVVGQTVGHEAIAFREVGIPVASLNIVSNYAEEGNRWIGDSTNAMSEFYKSCPPYMARVIANTVKRIFDEDIKPSSLEPYVLTGLEMFPVPGA